MRARKRLRGRGSEEDKERRGARGGIADRRREEGRDQGLQSDKLMTENKTKGFAQ